MIATIDPATGETLARFEVHAVAEIDARLGDAARAQAIWRWRPAEERAALLPRLAALLRAEKDALALLITTEMGKPVGEAAAEVEKCALNCDFYAEHAPAMLADAPVAAVPGTTLAFEPLGVILAIMPWNYPLWQVVRFLAPALAAGNGAILKHAANVPQSALALERLVREAGFPEGLFANLFVEPGDVAAVIADPRIAGVALTGSTEVGAIVAGQAGAALKKQVLELGGSDPFVVLADADLDRAAAVAVTARFTNAGQSCVNAKRFIVEAGVADAFAERFLAGIAALKLGNPRDAGTTLGPLARGNLRAAIDDQVRRSVASGAQLRTGGTMPEGPGFYYPATLLDHVAPGMAAFDEETFGPAAAIVRAADTDEAIALANRTSFGLGASIWTADADRGRALARRIDAGAVFVNAMVASDPRVPFGGIKRSGYGRELGEAGMKEFTNMKTIRVADPA
ncbi:MULTISPECIES: aldehyde dehydrogenase family protein [unclassified Sphingopyxis]|uniref:aldehyde dehydrogenase family protein n=1 Tax=unclassified Sphingopyxis TaxID=2614943 RepID=UPI0007368F6F|nr:MULTISPECIES: aldehyde dehydrogenase family protein [unclassified Sphingopyxis]KTE38399.1 succinate-semialdehyde dehydrogenase [Sphingopyxis sp. HIX]KTE84185.1 succinate-semialdehyde dehydrogenase [Sphingopyxis sp. HXXIV]